MSRAGLIRAEGQVVTSANGSDLVVIQQINPLTGQYEPRLITIDNFLLTLMTSTADVEREFTDISKEIEHKEEPKEEVVVTKTITK